MNDPSTPRENPRLFVVGECPSDRAFDALERRNGRRAENVARRLACTGEVGQRLAGLLGEEWPTALVPWRGATRYALRNLQDVPWSRRPYDPSAARLAASALAREARSSGGLVLALGLRVSQAFGGRLGLLRWEEVAGTLVGTLPHPSRKSRWWDDVERADDALLFARSISRGLDLECDPRGVSWMIFTDPSFWPDDGETIYPSRKEAIQSGLALGLDRFWTARATGPATLCWLSLTYRVPG